MGAEARAPAPSAAPDGADSAPSAAPAWRGALLGLLLAALLLALAASLRPAAAAAPALRHKQLPAAGALAAAALGPSEAVTVAVHGLAAGWRSGEPLVSLSFRHHVLAPLLREGRPVRVLLCLDSALEEGDLAALAREGAERVEQYVYASTKWGRRGQCYQRALQAFGAPRWWVAMRSDLLLYDDLPPLRALSHAAIHSRARLVRWDAAPLSTAHLSFGDACVEECPPPCPLFLRPFVVSDDALGLVPHAMAPAYFNGSIDAAPALAEAGGCAGVFHPDLARVWPPHKHYAQKRQNFLVMPELVFTCAVVALGGAFEPLALAARLNPYGREPGNWFGVQSPAWGSGGAMAWPAREERDCSGGAGGSALAPGGAAAAEEAVPGSEEGA
jgi:hypothetical protein